MYLRNKNTVMPIKQASRMAMVLPAFPLRKAGRSKGYTKF